MTDFVRPDYTYDSPDRTYDGEWGTTYDGGLDRVTITPGTKAPIAGLVDAANQSTLTNSANQTEVADEDL